MNDDVIKDYKDLRKGKHKVAECITILAERYDLEEEEVQKIVRADINARFNAKKKRGRLAAWAQEWEETTALVKKHLKKDIPLTCWRE